MCVEIRRCTSVSLVLFGTQKTGTFCDPRSSTPNTHGPSDTFPLLYFLLAPNLDLAISTVFPELNFSIQDLVGTDWSQLTQRLVHSRFWKAGKPQDFAARNLHSLSSPPNIRCSQVLNGMLDPSKKNPDLIESHIIHRLFVQHHMYLLFTHVVSATSISDPHWEQCWQLPKSFWFMKKLKTFWKVPNITRRSWNSIFIQESNAKA